MAIGFANVEVHGRSAGWSPAAGLAYRFGTCLEDRRTGLVHDYRHRQDPSAGGGPTPIEAATFAPEGAPGWVLDPQQLATRLDKKEPRRDSQLMREILLALPRELEERAALDLVARYVDVEFVRKGMVAAVAVHRHDPDNPHAHVLLTMRRLEGEGFGNKERSWNDRGLVELWRQAWGRVVNRALEQAGERARIDMRSYVRQGLEPLPAAERAERLVPGRGPWAAELLGQETVRDARTPARAQAAAAVNAGVAAHNERALELAAAGRVRERLAALAERERLVAAAAARHREEVERAQRRLAAARTELATARGWRAEVEDRAEDVLARPEAAPHAAALGRAIGDRAEAARLVGRAQAGLGRVVDLAAADLEAAAEAAEAEAREAHGPSAIILDTCARVEEQIEALEERREGWGREDALVRAWLALDAPGQRLLALEALQAAKGTQLAELLATDRRLYDERSWLYRRTHDYQPAPELAVQQATLALIGRKLAADRAAHAGQLRAAYGELMAHGLDRDRIAGLAATLGEGQEQAARLLGATTGLGRTEALAATTRGSRGGESLLATFRAEEQARVRGSRAPVATGEEPGYVAGGRALLPARPALPRSDDPLVREYTGYWAEAWEAGLAATTATGTPMPGGDELDWLAARRWAERHNGKEKGSVAAVVRAGSPGLAERHPRDLEPYVAALGAAVVQERKRTPRGR